MTHSCSIPDCDARVETGKLMCRRHWFQVPSRLRQRLWETWRKYEVRQASLEELRAIQAECTAAVKGGEE